MFDGFKIWLYDLDPYLWFENSELDFEKGFCTYKGLFLEVKESTKGKHGFLCMVRGSIARYYNQGKDNAFDFSFDMFKAALCQLESELHINPKTAVLQRVEVGCNIICPIDQKSFFKALKTHSNENFSLMKDRGRTFGYYFLKQQWGFKTYFKLLDDKANLLRFEYVITSQKKLKPIGLNTLIDLLDKDVIQSLIDTLLKVWKECVFDNKGFSPRNVPEKDHVKIRYLLDARVWAAFNSTQRYKAMKRLEAFKVKYSTDDTQSQILELIQFKFEEMKAVNSPKSSHILRMAKTGFESDIKNIKKSRFTDLDNTVKRTPFNPNTKDILQNCATEIINPKSKANTTKPKERKCLNCAKDISQKKKGAKFCSKTCNNAHHAKLRKHRRNTRKQREKALLAKYELVAMPTDTLKPTEKGHLVAHVLIVQQNGIRWEFTSYRARKAIKIVTQTKEKK